MHDRTTDNLARQSSIVDSAVATPEGILDLWGNVRELVLLESKYPPDRMEFQRLTVTVGGGYADDLTTGLFKEDGCTVAEDPRLAEDSVGFRVVLAIQNLTKNDERDNEN